MLSLKMFSNTDELCTTADEFSRNSYAENSSNFVLSRDRKCQVSRKSGLEPKMMYFCKKCDKMGQFGSNIFSF